jgi:hypothetical protein
MNTSSPPTTPTIAITSPPSSPPILYRQNANPSHYGYNEDSLLHADTELVDTLYVLYYEQNNNRTCSNNDELYDWIQSLATPQIPIHYTHNSHNSHNSQESIHHQQSTPNRYNPRDGFDNFHPNSSPPSTLRPTHIRFGEQRNAITINDLQPINLSPPPPPTLLTPAALNQPESN